MGLSNAETEYQRKLVRVIGKRIFETVDQFTGKLICECNNGYCGQAGKDRCATGNIDLKMNL